MRDPLDIDFPSNSYSIYPSEELKKHGEVLLTIKDLGEKLRYYNQHICSLSYSYPQEGLLGYGMYDHWHSLGTLILRKKSSGNDTDFEIFLQERQKEIERLKILIAGQNTYYGKLKCFIEEKAGQKRFDELKIESNEWETFIANGAGNTPKHLENHKAEIDLNPYEPDEIKSYNEYIREHAEKLFRETENVHWLKDERYKGFRALSAMDEMRKQVQRAFNKDVAVKTELNRLEERFKYRHFSNYIEFLYPYNIDDLFLWQAALFNAKANGYQYDYSRRKLSVHEMKALIHVEQCFIYYKYVHLLEKNTVYVSFEDLFNDAVENGMLSELKNAKTIRIEEATFRFLFNCWLQKRKSWEYDDLCDYQMHLTKKGFEEFLKEYKSEEQARIFLVGKTRDEALLIFQKSMQSIRDSFRIKRKVTEEDTIEQDPPFSTSIEAYALLTGYYGPIYMELEKQLFVEKYKVWNATTIMAEIKEIETFIEDAQTQSLSKACRAFYKWDTDTDAFIYLRLKSGFYEHLEIDSYPIISSFGNKEAHLYGRHFLFYNFLKVRLDALSQTTSITLNRPEDEAIAAGTTNSRIPETFDQDINSIRNNFDHVLMKDVYGHFRKGLVEKNYLTETELLHFLKAAFQQKQAPDRRFKFSNSPKKKQVMEVFYRYYTQVASKPHGKQTQYAALLGDYFEGYNTVTVKTNFNKTS